MILVQHSGHVLSKDDLIKAIWPDSFVEENNLTQQISQLRRALGEGTDGQSYIETVPKLGYRFIPEVREIVEGQGEVVVSKRMRTHIVLREEEESEESREVSEDLASSAVPANRSQPFGLPARWRQKSMFIAFTLIPLLLMSLAIYHFFRLSGSPVASTGAHTLAVLPLRNLKPDPETDFLSMALADAVIGRLEYVNEILVRPSSYVVKYRNGNADPRVIAHDLHVQSILTGSYIREGDHLRISAELIEVGKTEVLWHETFDLPYDQLLTVQNRVAENVARGLQLQILPQETQRMRRSAPKNTLAYEYYLHALTYKISNEYRLPIQMLEKSVSLDSDYAPAWMLLGQEYGAYASLQGGGAAFSEKSKAAFDKALELDPELPNLHTYLAIQMMEHGDVEKGLLTVREELRLNPNEAFAHWWLTEAYLYGGMLPESIAEGEHALQLDPLVNEGSTLNSYLYAGDYQKFLSTMPVGESARTTFYRGLCFFYMNDFSRAASEFERAYMLDPSLLHAKYGRALLYAIRQQPSEGLRYLKQLERETSTEDGEMVYKLAQAYAVLGDVPSAILKLHAAIDHGFYCYPCFVRDPLLVPLHGDAQYAELMKLSRERHESFKHKYF